MSFIKIQKSHCYVFDAGSSKLNGVHFVVRALPLANVQEYSHLAIIDTYPIVYSKNDQQAIEAFCSIASSVNERADLVLLNAGKDEFNLFHVYCDRDVTTGASYASYITSCRIHNCISSDIWVELVKKLLDVCSY